MTNAPEPFDPSVEWQPIPDDGRGVSAALNLLRVAACLVVLIGFTLPMLAILWIVRDRGWVRSRWRLLTALSFLMRPIEV